MKFSKDTKILAITAVASAAALFAVISKNINAGQQYDAGYHTYGYGPGYQHPASPGYKYYTPGDQSRMQVKRQPAHTTTMANPSAEDGASTNVTIAGMQFLPSTIRVKAGEHVTWINNESIPHTVTSHNNGLLASERLGRGSVFTHTFEQPGTYTYYCALHPSMTGKVVVE